MGRRAISIITTLHFAIAPMWIACSPISLAQHATPEVTAPMAIANGVLGRTVPLSVANPELSLGRVTFMPGGVLPVHLHLGTQIGDVVQGELAYSIFTSEIEWLRGDDPTGEPYKIGPGETVVVRSGDPLVESSESIHQGRNAGTVPLVISLSSLFPMGAPRPIGVEANPVP